MNKDSKEMSKQAVQLPARQETWVQSLDWDDPTPIFLPGEFYGQRNLAGYSPWGHKESDVTEQVMHTHMLRWCSGKESACQFRRSKRLGSDPWVRKIPWSRKEMATHSSTLAWAWTERPDGLRFTESQRVGRN